MTATPPSAPGRRALQRRTRLGLAHLALALGFGLACAACDPLDGALTDDVELDDDTGVDDDSAGSEGVSLSSVEYILSFSWGDAEALDSGGWATVNDLGYRVEVEHGYLISYSASLSPCTPATDTTSDANTTASLGERLLGELLLPQTAFAGHSSVADPSQLEAPTVEDLSRPESRTLGTLSFEPADYCWAHYLAAQADEDTPSLPTDADLEGITLTLEGQVWLDETHSEPFVVNATTASGVLVDLDAALSDGDDLTDEGRHATLKITRDLAHAFDGFDFTTDDPSDLDRLVLRHLVQEASIEVEVRASATA